MINRADPTADIRLVSPRLELSVDERQCPAVDTAGYEPVAATRLAASAGDSVFIGVDVECVNDGHCDDASECTDDTCVSNECVFTNNYCDDGDDCTTDTCNAGACSHGYASSGTSCEDGLFCTTPDECDGAGTCVGGEEDPCQETEYCVEFLDYCMPSQ